MWRKKPSWFEAQTVIAGLDPAIHVRNDFDEE
jgi:hypothetical protein